MMNPWIVNEENVKMVENNITYLLRNYLTNSTFDYVLFDWVLHREEILDGLLERLRDLEFELKQITLICSEESLRHRMELDHRTQEQIALSIERLKLYKDMSTMKVDTSETTIDEAVERIKYIILS
ncbi:hypothetical protein HMSSN036_19140 [Paenibacillus macerans]|nr:hypothetical protein HMSSN036_19140 [Paenibacillus macerans]